MELRESELQAASEILDSRSVKYQIVHGYFLWMQDLGDITWREASQKWVISLYSEFRSIGATEGNLCKVLIGELRSLGH